MSLVGTKIWLEYFDQNELFNTVYRAQYVSVVRQIPADEGVDDWYVVGLERPFEYKGWRYNYLAISSRWVEHRVGDEEPTAVFIMLVPDDKVSDDPRNLDRSLYIAWGFSAQNEGAIKR